MRDVVRPDLRPRDRDDIVLPQDSFVTDRVHEGSHPVARDPMLPREDPTGGIEPRAQEMGAHRPEAAVAHVVLARPHELDGPPNLFGEPDRIHDELLVAVAAP